MLAAILTSSIDERISWPNGTLQLGKQMDCCFSHENPKGRESGSKRRTTSASGHTHHGRNLSRLMLHRHHRRRHQGRNLSTIFTVSGIVVIITAVIVVFVAILVIATSSHQQHCDYDHDSLLAMSRLCGFLVCVCRLSWLAVASSASIFLVAFSL